MDIKRLFISFINIIDYFTRQAIHWDNSNSESQEKIHDVKILIQNPFLVKEGDIAKERPTTFNELACCALHWSSGL